MKIKRNPRLNVGDRVYLDMAYDEPSFITPARGTINKIELQGTSELGKELIKYYVDWDKGTQGGQPILSDVDIFFRDTDIDGSDVMESYIISKSNLNEMINKLSKNYH